MGMGHLVNLLIIFQLVISSNKCNLFVKNSENLAKIFITSQGLYISVI